jgi:serine/threonine-protein kinase
MKTSRTAFVILVVLWAAFAACVWLTAPQLPDRVATHFGAGGEPNGWMTRTGHVQFTLLFGLLVPAFVIGIFATMRYFGDGWINVPHKDYWLAPERREQTFAFMARQGFWFAGLFIAFLTGIHYSILAANARTPVSLPASDVVWIAGGFLVASVIWVVKLIARFSRRPA